MTCCNRVFAVILIQGVGESNPEPGDDDFSMLFWQRNLGIPLRKQKKVPAYQQQLVIKSSAISVLELPTTSTTSFDPHVRGLVKLQEWQPACHLVHGSDL